MCTKYCCINEVAPEISSFLLSVSALVQNILLYPKFCSQLMMMLEDLKFIQWLLRLTQDVSKPAKRKQTEAVIDTSIRLRPHKKPRTDPAAEDSPRQSRFRLKPQTQDPIDTIRNVPSKTSRPPITPSRGERRSERPKRSSQEQQTSEDDAQKKRKESSGKKDSRRDADMLQTVEICSDTQVREIHLCLGKCSHLNFSLASQILRKVAANAIDHWKINLPEFPRQKI